MSSDFITIRGLITGELSNPTVAVAIDDIPYGGTTHLGGGNAVPDLDPGDVVERLDRRSGLAEAVIEDVELRLELVIAGQVVGSWKRVIKKDALEIVPKFFIPLTGSQQHALALAANRYSQFLGLPVNWSP